MKMTIKAKYANGVLAPALPLDIEEGAEVTLSVNVSSELPQKDSVEKTEQHPDSGVNEHDHDSDPRDIQDILIEIAMNVPQEELDAFPPDFIENFDHYVYGVPKKVETE